LQVQLFDQEFADSFDFDVLDPTKIIPEEILKPQPIGRLVLDRMPDNFFAETEQVAFMTQNVPPGIDFSNDPLLQGRNFSDLDTQLKRRGGPHLPINAPKCPNAQFPTGWVTWRCAANGSGHPALPVRARPRRRRGRRSEDQGGFARGSARHVRSVGQDGGLLVLARYRRKAVVPVAVKTQVKRRFNLFGLFGGGGSFGGLGLAAFAGMDWQVVAVVAGVLLVPLILGLLLQNSIVSAIGKIRAAVEP
jgi:hypothetical protein